MRCSESISKYGYLVQAIMFGTRRELLRGEAYRTDLCGVSHGGVTYITRKVRLPRLVSSSGAPHLDRVRSYTEKC